MQLLAVLAGLVILNEVRKLIGYDIGQKVKVQEDGLYMIKTFAFKKGRLIYSSVSTNIKPELLYARKKQDKDLAVSLSKRVETLTKRHSTGG